MDRADSADFESITQMLLEQKKLLDMLEAENRELRSQLTHLRSGLGIAVSIEGRTIQLVNDEDNSMNGSSQATLQSLQNAPGEPQSYLQSGQQIEGQHPLFLSYNKRGKGNRPGYVNYCWTTLRRRNLRV